MQGSWPLLLISELKKTSYPWFCNALLGVVHMADRWVGVVLSSKNGLISLLGEMG